MLSNIDAYSLSENMVTNENDFNNRRKILSIIGLGAMYPAKNLFGSNGLQYKKDNNKENLKLNTFEQISTYNNFYEFSLSKTKPALMAQKLQTDPWSIKIDGLVSNPFTLDMETILKKYPLEERIYRFRCVEAWSMVVPWIGVELSYIIKKANPTSKAKYVQFETLYDPKTFPDQARGQFRAIDYPYVEGLRLDEAMNPLTIMAVGLYGKTMPKQNGAPARLVVPWKYGFKSIKSVVKITLTSNPPLNTWQKQSIHEYGFFANVNPNIDHPRWSQKKERVLGKFFKQKTTMFNGYEKQVAHMYKGMNLNTRKYQ
ncbi:Putative sulfite oxidase subunit YedY [hydrothermal vent metagenome]|uniref:Sulfite oxidase subunit YedY n=1 Tax=hydrothermal vent metagenome TaxID=652676 RepID=A0A3B1DS19_9ZZZZ